MPTIAISKETRGILALAAQVNNSIQIDAGNVIRTINHSQSIIVEATIQETFPESFSIYELGRFNTILGMMDAPTLEFNNSDHVLIKSDRTEVKFKFTDADFVKHPGNSIVLPSQDLRCRVSEQDLDRIRKLARVFEHDNLAFIASGGVVHMVTTTPELGDQASDNRILIEGAEVAQDGVYRILIGNLVMPSGDYDLTISAGGITEFKRVGGGLNVYLGLEQEA